MEKYSNKESIAKWMTVLIVLILIRAHTKLGL